MGHHVIARHVLAAAAIAAAGCRGSRAPGALPQVDCAASASAVPVGHPVTVRCVATPGAEGPTWSIDPALGQLAPQPDGSASYSFPAAAVTPTFPDTVIRVKAAYRSPAGETVGSAVFTVLGNTWLARSDQPSIQAVSSDGALVGGPQPLQGMAGPVLAMAGRSDGALLVAQSPQNGPPLRSYDPIGALLADFDAVDPQGHPLFDPAAPPRAVQQMRDGTVWVTGGKRPILYQADGRFRAYAAAAPAETIGVSQLPDGRVVASYRWAYGLGFFDETGQALVKRPLQAAVPEGEFYGALGALAALPGGRLLVAVAHFDPSGWTGTLLRLDAELSLEAELAPAGRVVRNVPWALAPAGPVIDAAPSPVAGDTVPSCPRRFATDLSGSRGCLAQGGSWLGVVHLGPASRPAAAAASGGLAQRR